MRNVYYDCEKFDLIVIDEIDTAECYKFNIHVVFKDGEGLLYYAHDSGCSCPTPFEGFRSVEDMEIVNKNSFENLESTIMGLDCPIGRRIKFLDNVRNHL